MNVKNKVSVSFTSNQERQPHRENLKDDYDRVAQRALEMKKQQALEKWFASKIPSYYLMVDNDFTHCANLSNWYQYAAKAAK